MKVYAIVTVATQVDGPGMAVKFDKAFTQASKAEEYASTLSRKWREVIRMDNADVDCSCQRGVHELDVEE